MLFHHLIDITLQKMLIFFNEALKIDWSYLTKMQGFHLKKGIFFGRGSGEKVLKTKNTKEYIYPKGE